MHNKIMNQKSNLITKFLRLYCLEKVLKLVFELKKQNGGTLNLNFSVADLEQRKYFSSIFV